MSDWQERITHETAPAIRAEHELRYRLAAPLIAASGTWADLGCGNGLAAAAAFGEQRPPRMVLVDLELDVVQNAARALGAPGAFALTADLTEAQDLASISRALSSLGGEPVVTCFEVLEHLASFIPLLEWAKELSRERAATVLMSVPNDAFWSIENPHHRTRWGEGAFGELRQLLPAELTLVRQVALTGSAMVGWDAAPERHELAVRTGGEGTIPTHFLAAFGPRHGDLARAAVVAQAQMLEQRRWERERESDLATAQQTVVRQRAELDDHEATIIKLRQEFVAWRAYIHELEGELGRPLSGIDPGAEGVAPADAGAEQSGPLGSSAESAEHEDQPQRAAPDLAGPPA